MDNFKGVNDAYGHLVGDDVLRAVAGQIHGATRSGDGTFRYGGEEFLVIFDRMDQGGAATADDNLYGAKRAGRNRVRSTLLGPQVLRGTATA